VHPADTPPIVFSTLRRKIMNRRISAGLPSTLFLVFSIFLFGCYPKGPEYYEDTDLTVTDYDAGYNFASQRTYWMADTVEYTTNIKDSELDDALVEDLISKVAENMASRGYQRLSNEQIDNADFALTISVVSSRNTGVGWVPGPPYYPGWGWGPGWGGWYPPYWGGYYSYSYTTGSVFIHWWDPQESLATTADGEDLQPVHWVGIFNGLVSSSSNNNASRVSRSVDQAFNQSPYIRSSN
jgi:hypothetical protein